VKRARALWLTALGLAVLAVALFWFTRRSPETPQSALQPQVTLATAREGSIAESIELAGRVGPPAGTQTKLAFSIPGTIAGVDVRLGEHVEGGATLARIDATSYALTAQQAQAEAGAATQGAALASIDRVSVRLRVDEAELARQRRLFHAGVVALRDVQAAEGTVAADRAEAAGARVALAQAQAQSRAASLHAAGASYDVARTTLRAPAAGTVVGVFVQPGQTVDPTIAVVALSSDRQGVATLDVPVTELARISAGDPVEARASGVRWSGRVEGIATAVDPATGLAVVSVSGVPAGTAAGTPVDASVITGNVRGLVIPASAIVEDPQTGAQLVFVRTIERSGAPHFTARNVTIGTRNAKYARVLSGLRPGEQVAAEGAIDLLSQPGGE
jgi:cobalt-zinc-cadmium efflux system membrane fusion protein